MSGLILMAIEPLITSVEYTSLNELVAIVHGIKIMYGVVITIIDITSSMIYLANADQLQNNNIKTRTTQHLIN